MLGLTTPQLRQFEAALKKPSWGRGARASTFGSSRQHSQHKHSDRYAPTGGSFVLPIMNDATLKQIAAAKVTVPKGSHVWISNHI
jgi:hypothetical protein